MRLKDRVAIITGSTRGIGKETAKLFAKEGAKVAICGTNEALISAVVEELKAMGAEALGFRVDVSKRAQVDEMVAGVKEAWGRIDILVNNAGISYKTLDGFKIPFQEIPEDQWDNVLTVNLKGMFLCSQKVAKLMIKQKYGRIVNIASTAANFGGFGPAGNHYRSSKAGVISLTKSLAFDLAESGIRVNCVAPGFIKTEMTGKTSKDINNDILKRIPMKRFGLPEEVAEAVLFLVSDSSSYINGETIIVDGGFTVS